MDSKKTSKKFYSAIIKVLLWTAVLIFISGAVYNPGIAVAKEKPSKAVNSSHWGESGWVK